MEAKYYDDGILYGAHIAEINGDTITVSWNDGDPHGRDVRSEDVFKHGVSCLPATGT